jgi:nitrogen PTS system EIIA component
LDLDVSTMAQVLERVAVLLAARHPLSNTLILESLIASKQLGSTAVGHGVAISHAPMTECTAPAAAVVRTKFAILFDAPDGKPVSVFIGLIVPNKAMEGHLRLLAIAASMLSDRIFREKLKTATDPRVVRDLLAAWPDAPATQG